MSRLPVASMKICWSRFTTTTATAGTALLVTICRRNTRSAASPVVESAGGASAAADTIQSPAIAAASTERYFNAGMRAILAIINGNGPFRRVVSRPLSRDRPDPVDAGVRAAAGVFFELHPARELPRDRHRLPAGARRRERIAPE